MWWFLLYILPVFICLLGVVFALKHEPKTTRRDLLWSLIIFAPIINIALVIACFHYVFTHESTKKWLDGAVIDRTKNKEL